MAKNNPTSIFSNFHVGQLANQIRLSVMTGGVLYIEGPPGVGKTQIVNQVAEEMGYTAVCFMLSEMMPEDIGGIITADVANGVAKRLCPDVVARIHGAHQTTGRPVLAFADEINNATAMMLSSCFKLLHEGVAGGYAVPEGTRFIAAGNDPATSNVAQDLPAPLYNRMTTVKFAGPSFEEFEQHGIARRFHPAVMGFLNRNTSFLISEADFTEAGAQPTPRSWESVSDYLKVCDSLATPLASIDRMYGLAGRVGEKAAKMMEASLKWSDKLVPFRDIIASPDTALAPADFIPAYMQCLSCASQIETVDDAKKCSAYVRRLPREVMSVFITSLLSRPDSTQFIDAFSIDGDIEGLDGFGARSNLGAELKIRQ